MNAERTVRYRNIVFDFDGTITDSKRDIAGAQLWVLHRLGVHRYKEEDLYPHIGTSLQETFAALLPEEIHGRIDEAVELYARHYPPRSLETTSLFPGVRETLIVILAALVLALPTTVLANKQVFKASISAANELHQVVGSSARGSATFASFPDGTVRFMVSANSLSGPARGVHLHGPATTSENAPVLLTLCGNPTPAAVTTCTTDANGFMYIEGMRLSRRAVHDNHNPHHRRVP